MKPDHRTNLETYLPQSCSYFSDAQEGQSFTINSQALLVGKLAQDVIKAGKFTPIEWLKWIPLGQQTDLFGESRLSEEINHVTFLICQPTKTNIRITQQAVQQIPRQALLKVAIFLGRPKSDFPAMKQLENTLDCYFYVDIQQNASEITRAVEHILRGIGDLYSYPSMVGIDLEDIRSVIQSSGLAHIRYSSPNATIQQLDQHTQQILNILLEDVSNHQPLSGMIALLHHGSEFRMKHLSIMMETIRHLLGDEIELIFSAVPREGWTEECQVTLIGCCQPEKGDHHLEATASLNPSH